MTVDRLSIPHACVAYPHQGPEIDIKVDKKGRPVAYRSPPQSPGDNKENEAAQVDLTRSNVMGNTTPTETPTPQAVSIHCTCTKIGSCR